MVLKFAKAIIGLSLLTLLSGCYSTPEQLKKVIEENPDIVLNMIKKNPKLFFDTLNESANLAKSKGREDEQKKIEAALEADFKNPKKPELVESRVFFGPKTAKITIVEYSDFQCPFCKRGYNTVEELRKKFGKNIHPFL